MLFGYRIDITSMLPTQQKNLLKFTMKGRFQSLRKHVHIFEIKTILDFTFKSYNLQKFISWLFSEFNKLRTELYTHVLNYRK